jgi:hypothetical protein
MQQIESPTATMPDGEAFYACALLHWSLMEPYFSTAFAKGLLPVYAQLFLDQGRPKKKRRSSLGPIAVGADDIPE